MKNSSQRIYQVDAFADAIFGGNPAAVCILDNWLPEKTMQQIAAENNLAETAFLVKRTADYEIRWFTPAVEVALCGHATLASAHVLFEHLKIREEAIDFYSQQSGCLSVTKSKGVLTLNFPKDDVQQVTAPEESLKAFNIKPLEVYKGKTDYLLLFKDQAIV